MNKEYKELLELPLLTNEDLKSLVERTCNGDQQAKEELYFAYLKVVPKIARQFSRGPTEFEDMVSEGNMALWKAIDKLNPDKWQVLLFYFQKTIKNTMINYLRDKKFVVKQGQEGKHCEPLEYEDSDDMIVHEELVNLNNSFIDLHNKDFKEKCVSLILKEFGEEKLDMFFKVINKEKTYEEIGESYGLTKARICQIYYDVLNYLKNQLEEDT